MKRSYHPLRAMFYWRKLVRLMHKRAHYSRLLITATTQCHQDCTCLDYVLCEFWDIKKICVYKLAENVYNFQFIGVYYEKVEQIHSEQHVH